MQKAPSILELVSFKTAASCETFTPPYVNVIPPVTGYARKGGVSILCAQLDFDILPEIEDFLIVLSNC